ncbi:Gfo/Idh/MocA family protein [Galbitalea soli]|uniref:Gfo/Idh/MocA family oxidoreductase n=1 Tax=Galbitalea soli TaxID=1268042 RepID=A0A7C9TPV3_9MICO|nr:Gfo/Idh/MocA family oxidoreductase [Galbitalea soli]NEM89863.1 Gfo/Idh/MocA family oxidoreductase [Galbitalea soli]NYJ30567.1 putative dehydrogenase [Galbitalea soli]
MPANSAPIRTGIIGFGLSGRIFHEPFLAADPAFRIDLIATGDPTRRAQAEALGHPTVPGPGELLNRLGELDLVVLASPAHVHLEQGVAALEAGVAVVVDKPFAASAAEAEQLIAVSERTGAPLIVFQNRRWDGDFRTIQALVAEGRLGRVHRFESSFERYSGAVRERWQDTTPIERGAGISYDLGSHLVDQALHLFGPATLQHAEVSVVRSGGVSDDDAFFSLRHETGVISHLAVSRVAAQAGPRFRVLGTEDAYTVYGLDPQEATLRAGGRPGDAGFGEAPEAEWGMLGGGSSGPELRRVPTLRGEYAAFYAGVAASIRDGAPVPVNARDSLAALRILDAAHGR